MSGPAELTALDEREQPVFVSTPAAGGLSAAEVLRSAVQLLLLSLRRQFWSRQTLICLGLSLLVGVIVWAWTLQPDRTPRKLANQVLLATFVGFLCPVFAISYGASSLGGEREDRTLIYVLLTPLPRPVLYLAKGLAALALTAGWTLATLALYCGIAGDMGWKLWPIFWPGCLTCVAAYTTLFLALGTLFRHGTILSLSYWFFLEVLFGLVPGLVKRITISFYAKSAIYAAGHELRVGPQRAIEQAMFLPVSGPVALGMLIALTGLFLVLGMLVFTTREYRELG